MKFFLRAALVCVLIFVGLAAWFDSPKMFARALVCRSSGDVAEIRARELWIVRTFGKLGELWISPCSDQRIASLSPVGIDVQVHPFERRDGRRVGRLDRDFVYCFDPTEAVIKVPEGFFTDFASIPKYSRFFFDPMGDQIEAAVLHDWLYSVGKIKPDWNRRTADELFRYALLESNVNIIRRNIMYWAVRLFARSAYNTGNDIEMRRTDWSTYSMERPTQVSSERSPKCKGFGG